MGANRRWTALLADYEAAAAEFERVSRELTAALVGRRVEHDSFEALLAAEEKARDAVTLTRMRLLNLWREASLEVTTPASVA